MPLAMRITEWFWGAFFVYWLLAALSTKRTQRRETSFSRLGYVLLAAAGFVLMFKRSWPMGILDRHWMPASVAGAVVGLALVIAGLAFAIWARLHIGRNWSGTVTVKVGHQLIRSGPYAWVRHPIYSGLILAMAGTAVEARQIRSLLAVALVWLGFWIKTRIEERFMIQTFGAEYESYRRTTGAFIPWRREYARSASAPGSSSVG